MRVAVIVAFVSVLTTPSEASTSCMSKTEARQHFGSAHLQWHGPEHCWDATPTRPHVVRHRVRHEPELTPRFVVPMPSTDLRRSANAMATGEPGTRSDTGDTMGRALDRYHAGLATEAHRRRQARARTDGHAARRNHDRNDACDCRTSNGRHEIGRTHSSPSARS